MTKTATNQNAPSLAQLRAAINRAQGLATSLTEGLTPYLKREASHLEEDLEVLERWVLEAGEEGADAMVGGLVVIETALKRVDYFQTQVGGVDQGLSQRLQELHDALRRVKALVGEVDLTSMAYVTYVNRSFAARYFDPQVQVRTILSDAGREDVDELGLYPLDDLFGEAIPDLAFPADQEVDLREDHRIYWESESDGGSIA